MTKIGNAPVSYGAFEVTVGIDENVPSAERVLDSVQAAGYEGIDLGPLGYFGLGAELKEALTSRGLLLAGGYVEIDVSSKPAAQAGFDELARICDQFDAVDDLEDQTYKPRPTVALLAPAEWRSATSEPDVWERIIPVIDEVVGYCDQRGYQACLHNEVGTLLSGQQSLIRALESTAAHLCLDTGHLIAAGGDPLAIVEWFRDQVTHVHLKDARPSPTGEPYEEAMELWENDVFCPLGAGEGDLDRVLESLRSGGYSGWILVEQDVLPRSAEAYQTAAEDQVANRQYLRDRGW
jgi:inosose dehydratase